MAPATYFRVVVRLGGLVLDIFVYPGQESALSKVIYDRKIGLGLSHFFTFTRFCSNVLEPDSAQI